MSDEGTGEPEVGSQEWLLQQLSGGRLTTRRQLREAEAAAAKAGIPLSEIPPQTGAIPIVEQPAVLQDADAVDEEPPAPVPAVEERQKARFSWETGVLEPVTPLEAPADAAAEEPVEQAAPLADSVPEPAGAPLDEPSEAAAEDAGFTVEPGDHLETPDAVETVETAEPEPAEPEIVQAVAAPDAAGPADADSDATPSHAEPPVAAPSEDAGFTLEPAEATAPVFAETAAEESLLAAPAGSEDDGLQALGLTGEVEPLPADFAPEPQDVPALDEAEEPVFFWGLEPNGEADPVVAASSAAEPGASAPIALDAVDEAEAAPAASGIPETLGSNASLPPLPEVLLQGAPALVAAAPEAEELFTPSLAVHELPTEALAIVELPTAALETVDIPTPRYPGAPAAEDADAAVPTADVEPLDEPEAPADGETPADTTAPIEPEAAESAEQPAEPDAAELPTQAHEFFGGLFADADDAPVEPEVEQPVPEAADVDSTAALSAIPATEPMAPVEARGFLEALEQDAGEHREFEAAAVGGPLVGVVAATGASAAAPKHPTRGSTKALIWIAAALVLILVVIGLFALGRAVGATKDAAAAKPAATTQHSRSPSPSATPTPTPTVDVPATGALPAGTWSWDRLRGGECIDPFAGAWAQDFTVVDCAAPHAGQLVYTAAYATDPNAAYPGQQQIGSQINLLCTKPGVLNLSAAGAYNDIQVVGSYPATEEQWKDGQRNYYCFVDRASGGPIAGSLQGSGPSA